MFSYYRTSICYNDLTIDPVVYGNVCNCTIEDYQCDYCYMEDHTGNCTWVCEGSPNQVPSPCRGEYVISKG